MPAEGIETEASFNPRAREGRDVGPEEGALTAAVSIHAPVKGATQLYPASKHLAEFQSTRP